LSINVLKVIIRPCDGIGTPSQGGPDGSFSNASTGQQKDGKRLIFSGTKRGPATRGFFEKKFQWDGESLASSSVYGQGRGT